MRRALAAAAGFGIGAVGAAAVIAAVIWAEYRRDVLHRRAWR